MLEGRVNPPEHMMCFSGRLWSFGSCSFFYFFPLDTTEPLRYDVDMIINRNNEEE